MPKKIQAAQRLQLVADSPQYLTSVGSKIMHMICDSDSQSKIVSRLDDGILYEVTSPNGLAPLVLDGAVMASVSKLLSANKLQLEINTQGPKLRVEIIELD